ncbi:uncharacterized protein [Centruroides vittatus]|uniref:uncharacterized protein n=1 Tax=Centruroides vittatus TaxID=120091 RepID=UPI00350EF010
MPYTLDIGKKRSFFKRRPFFQNAIVTDLQNGSYIASIFAIFESVFVILQTVFDAYILIEAEPGTIHYRYFGINFLFVYSGNRHVRNILLFICVVTFLLYLSLLVTSVILMNALRKEKEKKFQSWLTCIVVCTVWTLLAITFRSVANDLYYSYHQAILVIFIIILILNTFFGLVVYSNYQELEDITRLEDMARLKTSTFSSLSTSRSLSHCSIDILKTSLTTPSMGSTSTASV